MLEVRVSYLFHSSSSESYLFSWSKLPRESSHAAVSTLSSLPFPLICPFLTSCFVVVTGFYFVIGVCVREWAWGSVEALDTIW